MLITQFILRKEVMFIKNKDDRYAISLSTSKEPINKGGGCLRIIYCYNKESLINIGCNDMALF